MTSALRKWRHLLAGRPVKCVTDHKGLLVLTNPEAKLTTKVARWLADLVEFDASIVHVDGESNMMALSDWLSRNPAATVLEARAAIAPSVASPVPV